MGATAENIAAKWQISREEQDRFAAGSQNKAEAAQKAGRFKDEIAPFTVSIRKGDVVVDHDEFIRVGATYEALAKLRPVFAKEGTVTAGNASGVNDGAAALVVMTAAEAARRNLTPLARIASWATAGVDPAIMGTGAIPASRKALERAGWTVKDLDLVEANEAFAAQALAVNKEMGWIPPSSTSTAAQSRSATQSAPRARAYWSRCSTKWRAATPRRVWRRCASAAAWALH